MIMSKSGMKPVYFIDLDGTLYDDRWRLPLVDSGSQDPWRRYHLALADDKVMNPYVLDLILKATRENTPIRFLTARPSRYRHITLEKLNYDLTKTIGTSISFADDKLIMRPNQDNDKFDSSAAWKVYTILKHHRKMSNHYPVCIDNDSQISDLAMDNGILFILIQHWAGESQFEYKTVEFFSEIMKIHSERHKAYGQNYLRFGPIMKSLMGQVTLKTEKDWNRIAIMIHMLNKLTRYCSRWNKGGHEDSLNDLAVYSLILKELDEVLED